MAFTSDSTSLCDVHFFYPHSPHSLRFTVVILLLFDFTRASFSFTASSFHPPLLCQCHQLFDLVYLASLVDYWSYRQYQHSSTIISYLTGWLCCLTIWMRRNCRISKGPKFNVLMGCEVLLTTTNSTSTNHINNNIDKFI